MSFDRRGRNKVDCQNCYKLAYMARVDVFVKLILNNGCHIKWFKWPDCPGMQPLIAFDSDLQILILPRLDLTTAGPPLPPRNRLQGV